MDAIQATCYETETLLRIDNQANLFCFHTAPRFKFGLEVPSSLDHVVTGR